MKIRHRFQMALTSLECTHIPTLGTMLHNASKEAIEDEVFPYLDPACRLIAHQIAFACNGDLTQQDHYKKIIEYLTHQVATGPNFEPVEELVKVEQPKDQLQ